MGPIVEFSRVVLYNEAVSSSGRTFQRMAAPTAVLVALRDDLAAVCTESLADGGLKVLRVAHVAAACERIPVVMPQLVVAPDTLGPEDTETLNDRCVAVGAEVLRIADDADQRQLAVVLRDAANMALIRALRRGG